MRFLKILLAIVAGVAVVAAGLVVVAVVAVLVVTFLLVRLLRRRLARGNGPQPARGTSRRPGGDVIEVNATEVRTETAVLSAGTPDAVTPAAEENRAQGGSGPGVPG